MPTPVIEVRDVWKRYRRHEYALFGLGDVFNRYVRRRAVPKELSEFWALREVDFAIAQGEALGIIGRNGSGKSTMLKILSGVAQQTRGTVKVRGKVSALIEVGAGFHPDLTGRENVFLYGSIMGMSRRDVRRQFDGIVDFAGLHEQIDTPVKRYSTGQYMRLGFAVAAHVEPDILIIDEVLAVGDEAFQRKCLEKVAEMRQRGVTIAFVSHDMIAVRIVCDRVCWLERGAMKALGEKEAVVRQYQESMLAEERDRVRGNRQVDLTSSVQGETAEVQVERIELLDREGRPCEDFRLGDPLRVRLRFQARRPLDRPTFGVSIHKIDGYLCYGANTGFDRIEAGALEGPCAVEITFPTLNLLPGTYRIACGISEGDNVPLAMVPYAAFFQVEADKRDYGTFYLPHDWRIESGVAALTPRPPLPRLGEGERDTPSPPGRGPG